VGIATDITEQKEYEDVLRIAKEKAQESDMLKSTFWQISLTRSGLQ
jgi:hypothetical protein